MKKTKSFKQYVRDLFANPDGSGSTKRTAGNLVVLCIVAISVSVIWMLHHEKLQPGQLTEISMLLGVLFGGAAMFYGISSYDSTKYFGMLKDNTDIAKKKADTTND